MLAQLQDLRPLPLVNTSNTNHSPAPRRPDNACSIVISPPGNTHIACDVLTPNTRKIFQLYMGGGDSSAHGTHNVLTGHPDFSRVTDAAGDLMNDTDDLLNDTLLALQSPKDPATAISQEELHRQHETASWRTQHKKRKVNNGSDVFLNNLSPVLSFFVSTWCLYFITAT